MSCGDVRDRLPEHALGLLPPEEAASVERHLEWCGGCRKELGELQEGLASFALGLPPSEPPAALEERVVERVARAAGRRRPVRRRGARVLAATTVAAILLSLGTTGWGIAQRDRAADLALRDQQNEQTINQLRGLVDAMREQFERFGAGGRQIRLEPVSETPGIGLVALLPLETGTDLVWTEAVLPDSTTPYTLLLVNGEGTTRLSAQLVRTNNGTRALSQQTSRDMREVVSAVILDANGDVVLTGHLEPDSLAASTG